MTPALLALLAATSWAVSQVFVRLGSRSVAPLAGVVLSLGSSVVVLIAALLIRGVVTPDLKAVGVFALAGVLGPGIGRILSITAVSKIGATRASPVKSAAQPIIAVGLGVVVLSETLALNRIAGIVLALSGVLIVVRSGQRTAARAAATVPAGGGQAPDPVIGSNLYVLLWPIAAGAMYAFADLTRKSGMQIMDDAFVGGVIGVLVAFLIWGTVMIVRGEVPALLRGIRSHDSRWFMVSGVCAGAAQVFVLSALRDGDLSLVSPILATQPILIAILARTFINGLEKVGLSVAVAALLAGAGTLLLSL